MKNIFTLFIITILISSCVTTNDGKKTYTAEELSEEQISKYNAKVEEDKRIVCRNEKPLGSNIATRKCYTVAELKKREENDKENLRRDQSKRITRDNG
tara:strand:+ start:334 stop:627 length:294 start_codon:yes stop_codon:yes gene_type:complete